MRINKEKFPILDWLKMSSQEFGAINPIRFITDNEDHIDAWEDVIEIIYNDWELLKWKVDNNIDLVSDSFERSSLKGHKIISNISFEEFSNEEKPCGIILLSKGSQIVYDYSDYGNALLIFFRNNVLEIFYKVTDRKAIVLMNDIKTNVLELMDKSLLTGMFGEKKAGEIFKRIQSEEMKTMWNDVTNGPQEEKDKLKEFHVKSIINHIQSILLFKYYAKVETVHVKPKEKAREPNSKEKHFNETDIPINILDCTWFNNIIRDEPFGVKGHFRLQPKKNDKGQWIKELIYIKPFMKKGYNIKAKKEQL